MNRLAKQNVRSKERYYRLKSEGLCTTCGKHEATANRIQCRNCADKADQLRKGPEPEVEMKCHPITLTGDRYRVNRTGKVGIISPCACDDPIILQFPDGNKHVFHAKEVERVEVNKS